MSGLELARSSLRVAFFLRFSERHRMRVSISLRSATGATDPDHKLGSRRANSEGHDVPDHCQTDLEALPEALASAFRLPDAAPKSYRDLDYGKAPSHGNKKHVR